MLVLRNNRKCMIYAKYMACSVLCIPHHTPAYGVVLSEIEKYTPPFTSCQVVWCATVILSTIWWKWGGEILKITYCRWQNLSIFAALFHLWWLYFQNFHAHIYAFYIYILTCEYIFFALKRTFIWQKLHFFWVDPTQNRRKKNRM